MPEIEPLGECAVLLRLGTDMSLACNTRVHAAVAAIRALRLESPGDVLPAYASVLVTHPPLARQQRARLYSRLQRAVAESTTEWTGERRCIHEIPVCYGGHYGPDLESLAAGHGMPVREVVRRHAAATYQVAMIGFSQGFPYLLGLDPKLATPRLETPRTRVPAGSVGIAGAQSGIYPADLPGGWQLIGRTPQPLFRAENEARPCLLEPGDRVRFHPINAGDFEALVHAAC